jgi:hypothetical protein
VPSFITDPTTTSKRNLVALSEIDVSRDIMEVKFIKKSEEPVNSLQYSLELKYWTSDGMGVKAGFKDPLMVSKGDN